MQQAVKAFAPLGLTAAPAPGLRLQRRLGTGPWLPPRLPGAAVRGGRAAAARPPPVVATFRSRRIGSSGHSQDGGAVPGSNGTGPVKWVMERGPNTLHSVSCSRGERGGRRRPENLLDIPQPPLAVALLSLGLIACTKPARLQVDSPDAREASKPPPAWQQWLGQVSWPYRHTSTRHATAIPQGCALKSSGGGATAVDTPQTSNRRAPTAGNGAAQVQVLQLAAGHVERPAAVPGLQRGGVPGGGAV